jgi:hypothetical protein
MLYLWLGARRPTADNSNNYNGNDGKDNDDNDNNNDNDDDDNDDNNDDDNKDNNNNDDNAMLPKGKPSAIAAPRKSTTTKTTGMSNNVTMMPPPLRPSHWRFQWLHQEICHRILLQEQSRLHQRDFSHQQRAPRRSLPR